jgi:hypothetical protein
VSAARGPRATNSESEQGQLDSAGGSKALAFAEGLQVASCGADLPQRASRQSPVEASPLMSRVEAERLVVGRGGELGPALGMKGQAQLDMCFAPPWGVGHSLGEGLDGALPAAGLGQDQAEPVVSFGVIRLRLEGQQEARDRARVSPLRVGLQSRKDKGRGVMDLDSGGVGLARLLHLGALGVCGPRAGRGLGGGGDSQRSSGPSDASTGYVS